MQKLQYFLENASDPDFVERFLEEETFPIVEGDTAVFFFQGAADAVNLRHWIFSLPSAQPCTWVRGTHVWYTTLEMPRGSRVEYKFEIVRGEQRVWIMDPLNDARAHDPFGANSVCYGEGYREPTFAQEFATTRPGTLEEFVIRDTPLGPRRLQVYLPARFHTDRRYRLLVVHDGLDYLRFASLKNVLDNTIHSLAMAPVIVALTHPEDRLTEYPNNPRHAAYISEVLLPWMENRYPLYQTPEARCLMGASFGAVASLSTAWRYPGCFGRLLLQSGSFAFTDIGEQKRGPLFERVVEFVNAFRKSPGRPSDKAYVSCGMYESLIYENRSMIPVFQGTGMDVKYTEARDGHNWENWRDRLYEALSWLFPGPQWMYYE